MFDIIGYIFILVILCTMFSNMVAFRRETQELTNELRRKFEELRKRDVPKAIESLTAEDILHDIHSHKISADRRYVPLEMLQNDYFIMDVQTPGAVLVPDKVEAVVPELAPGRESPKTITPKSTASPSPYRKSITEILHEQSDDPLLYKPDEFIYTPEERFETINKDFETLKNEL